MTKEQLQTPKIVIQFTKDTDGKLWFSGTFNDRERPDGWQGMAQFDPRTLEPILVLSPTPQCWAWARQQYVKDFVRQMVDELQKWQGEPVTYAQYLEHQGAIRFVEDWKRSDPELRNWFANGGY